LSFLFGGARRKTPLGQVTFKQSVTFPANQPALKPTLSDIQGDILATAGKEIQIPQGEEWIITDVFIAVAGDVPAGGDAFLTFEKNRRFPLTTVGPLSTMLIGNQQRPRLKAAVGYVDGQILRVLGTNIAAIAGAPITDNFYTEIVKNAL